MAKDLRLAFGRPRGRSPIHILCPRHEDSDGSLAVYHDHGWCYGGCGYFTSEALLQIAGVTLETLPELSEAESRALEDTSGAGPPPESLIDVWHQTLVDPRSPCRDRLDWFRRRGIRLSTVREQRLGYTGRYYVIPVWHPTTGALQGIRKRRDDLVTDPDAPRYLQPAGQPALRYRPKPGGRYQAITEGELDALLLSQYGVDAMTSTAGADSLAKVFAGWSSRYPIWVLTDQDDAGDAAYEALRGVVRADLRRVRWRGAKDVTDALRDQSDAERLSILLGWFT